MPNCVKQWLTSCKQPVNMELFFVKRLLSPEIYISEQEKPKEREKVINIERKTKYLLHYIVILIILAAN
jgi:hypothetical protein